MKIKTLITIAIIISPIIFFISCEEDELGENEIKISRYNDDESHKNGQNCMNCHTSGGGGEGWFTIAGSVYDSLKLNPYPNATIRLFEGPNDSGALIKTIEVDGKGNFYTTESVDFDKGLYTSLTDNSGNVKFMKSSISTGQCNSCHGVSTDKIWIE